MDTLEFVTDTPITEEQLDVLKRIRRNVKRSENEYALYFVECNLPNLRKQLINELDNTDNLNLLTLNIADYLQDESLHIDEWVNLKKAEYQSENSEKLLNGINIVGLERLLPTDSNEQIIQTVSELNWRRSYFQELSIPIIFWLPSYALALLANQASDFYDWYSDTFYFKGNLEQKKFAASNQLQSLRHPKSNISAQYYQSSAEKQTELKKLKALLDESSTHNDEAYTRSLIAELLFSMGRLDEALKYWKDAKDIAVKIGDEIAKQTLLSNISQIYQNQGNYDRALECLLEAQKMNQNSDINNDSTAISNNLGLIYMARGEHETALLEFEKSLKTYSKINDDVAISIYYINMGSVFCKMGHYDKALEFFNKALYLSMTIENKSGLSCSLNGIAIVYRNKKVIDLAFEYFEEALKLCNEIGDRVLSSTILYNMSEIHFEKENFDLSLECLNKSLVISREIGDAENVEITLSTIGSIEKLIN